MSEAPKKNLFKGYFWKLNVGVLPSALFAGGHTYFVQVRVGGAVRGVRNGGCGTQGSAVEPLRGGVHVSVRVCACVGRGVGMGV